MDVTQLGLVAGSIAQPRTYSYSSRVLDTAMRRSFLRLSNATLDARDYALVKDLQSITLYDLERVQSNNIFLPANGVQSESLEFPQVSVMMVLR
jgi:hypothetical protein